MRHKIVVESAIQRRFLAMTLGNDATGVCGSRTAHVLSITLGLVV